MERDGPSALETTLPFDERQVLEENRPFLTKALEVKLKCITVAILIFFHYQSGL